MSAGHPGLGKLDDFLDRLVEADQAFFERHANRQYRVRRASRFEIVRNGIVQRQNQDLPPGSAWFAFIRHISPGTQIMAFAEGPAEEDANLSEADCKFLFEELKRRNPELAAEERRAIERYRDRA